MLHRNIEEGAHPHFWNLPCQRTAPAKLRPALQVCRKPCPEALHNRASEALRNDHVLTDPDSVRIHQSLDYDFGGRFGPPAGTLAARAAEIDRVLKCWIARHPDGQLFR